MIQDIFIKYDSSEQYATAFLKMIETRERWREETSKKTPQTNIIIVK